MKSTEINNSILSVIDCTERLKRLSDSGQLTLPDIPVGREKFTSIRKGSRVMSSGKGTFIRGLLGKVIKTEKNNGYNRYTVRWDKGGESREREQDIERPA